MTSYNYTKKQMELKSRAFLKYILNMVHLATDKPSESFYF